MPEARNEAGGAEGAVEGSEDTQDELGGTAHIDNIDTVHSDPDLFSRSIVHPHPKDSYDVHVSSANIAGTTPTQADFSLSRFRTPSMTAKTASPQRTGVSPSSSPRLPSPPPFTEVQIGPKSPTVGEGPEFQLGESAKQDDGSTRRIRPGTKAADMASGPPLIPLSEVGAFSIFT